MYAIRSYYVSLLDVPCATELDIHHPGGVGDVLRDPDGGSWIRGQIETSPAPAA